MGSKGLKSAIICVFMLSFVLEQVQQVEGKVCCPSPITTDCYNLCRVGLLRKDCARFCRCKIVSEDTCPPVGHPTFNFVPNHDEPDRIIEYCRLGCRSSVCRNMGNVHGRKVMKMDMESCGEACDRFCNGDVSVASDGAE